MSDPRDGTAAMLKGARQYRRESLRWRRDLRTSASCSVETLPAHLRDTLGSLHPDVRERFHGCGSPPPSALAGASVIDPGGGSGRDAYLRSRRVNEHGRVIGIGISQIAPVCC